MASDKIAVSGDPRVQRCSAVVNGTTYGYLLAVPPSGKFRATVFLVHGFPDLSMGWRYQIPTLLNLGLRVVAPDFLGYGRTDAPEFTPESAWRYGFKQCAADMKELARQLGSPKIILGGHDWGGAIVYRIALFHPELVTHIFSVCTPFSLPQKDYISLEQVIERIPFFGYQNHFANGGLENILSTRKDIRQFLIGMYGGRTPEGNVGLSVMTGVLLENLPTLKPSSLLSEEELEYYADEFARNGLHGPFSWYRTREQNYKDELEIVGRTLDIPILFIRATNDPALRPELSVNMDKLLKNLTINEVVASHWALWQAPEECNKSIAQWFESVVFENAGKL